MWGAVPIGALPLTFCAVVAVVPFRRPRSLATASWLAGIFPGELPFVFALVVVGPNVVSLIDGELTDRDVVTLVLTVVVVASLAVVVGRALRTRSVLERSLADALGAEVASSTGRVRRRSRRWLRLLVAPWPMRPRSVVRTKDVAYGERGVEQLVDVYRHRSRPDGAPTLIHLHGGGFRHGRKSREARLLLFRLAAEGWTCISANYHLSRTPIEGYPTHLIDVKRLLAWARADGRDHGIDPDAIVVAGTSAGAHLTAMAALTANDPAFQPGFEDADTSIRAGIGFAGYYSGLDGSDGSPTSPLGRHGAIPPFFVVHGDRDTFASPDGARRLVRHLRAQPSAVVVHAELPGGQHTFDLFRTIRFEAVVDAVEVFTHWVLSRPPAPRDGRSASPPG